MRGSEMNSPKTTKASGQADFCDDAFYENFTMNNDVHDKKAQAINSIGDELRESFRLVAEWPTGSAVDDKDFLLGVIDLFRAVRAEVAVSFYVGAGIDEPSSIEIAGNAPRASLTGLRLARRCATSPALCWRQGYSGDAPLYALDGLGQLADLLATARKVR